MGRLDKTGCLAVWTGGEFIVFFFFFFLFLFLFFFFQAEDGIRDTSVTGVQTCALPILDDLAGWGLDKKRLSMLARLGSGSAARSVYDGFVQWQIGRASCRERV